MWDKLRCWNYLDYKNQSGVELDEVTNSLLDMGWM